MPKRLTHAVVKETIEKTGYRLISTEYVNNKTPLDIECGECKEPYQQIFSSFQLGFRHQNCKAVTRHNNAKGREGGAKKGKKRTCAEKKCSQCGETFMQKRAKQILCGNKCRKDLEQSRRGTGHYEKIGRMGGLISAQRQFRRSNNEIYFAMLCQQIFPNVLTNTPIFDGWDADVILPDLHIAISWNGAWHYKKLRFAHNLEQVQARDKLKDEIIQAHGYDHHIIVDMGGKSKKFVEEKFKEFIDEYEIELDDAKFEETKNNGTWARAQEANVSTPIVKGDESDIFDDEE